MWTAAATPLLLGAACIVAFVRVQRAARRKLLLRAANVSKRRRAKKQKRKQQPRSRRDDSEAFHFIPIGHVRSCFPGCRGVPRQGALAPLTRAQLVLTPEVQPCALDGINEWSHIWITFVFHKNRKTGKTSSTGRRSIKYKIEPPKHTKKVGIFATRSPHRVNPIGQTIARVAKVTGRTLELRGVDLVDGTPVLDIKPYVPAYESIPGATMAPWVANAYDAPRLDVQISDSAAKQLEAVVKRMRHFNNAEDATAALKEVISLDIRDGGARSNNKRQGKALDSVGELFCFDFDGLKITTRVENEDGSQLQIVDITALQVQKKKR